MVPLTFSNAPLGVTVSVPLPFSVRLAAVVVMLFSNCSVPPLLTVVVEVELRPSSLLIVNVPPSRTMVAPV